MLSRRSVLALGGSIVSLANHCRDSSQQQADVGADTPGGDIQIVELDHLLERDAVAAKHLPQPGNARLQIQAPVCPVVHVRVLLEDQRAWPDEAHLTAYNIPELRQFIDREPPQHSPDPRRAWVIFDLEHARIAAV